MASNKRTIYLGLDYSNFTGGITEVNRKMGLLDAEFKLAQEQAKNYGTATDQLGIKQDYLREKIDLQTKKVEEAKKAYNAAMSSQQASQKQIDALDKKLLQERTALERLEGQLRETDNEQKNLNKSTSSFGDEIRGIATSLGGSVSPAIENLASKFDGLDKNVGNAIVGISAIVSGFISCSVSAAQAADDLLTLSSTTNITTDELQKLQYASSFVDVSVETMTGAMTKLTRNMESARRGSGEAADAFEKLHIRVTKSNGELRDANDVFYEAIDKLGKMTNETQRDAYAMEMFGKSARELNPLIEAGSKRLRELGIEAEDLGVIMGEDDLEALGALQDAFDKFDSTTAALKNSLGLALLPILTALFDAISAIPVPVLQTLVTLASVVATVLLVVKAIKSLTETGSAITKFFKGFNVEGLKTTAIVLGIVAALIALAAIIAVIAGKADETQKTLASVNGSVSGLQNTVTGVQTNTYRAANHATGTTNFAGGRTWVGEDGPELVTLPRGAQITPASQAGTTEYNTFYVTIDAKNVDDFNRVVEMVLERKSALRRS